MFPIFEERVICHISPGFGTAVAVAQLRTVNAYGVLPKVDGL